MNRFRSYPWPGNVRELQNVLQQALLRASGTVLISEFLPNDVLPETQTSAASDTETRYRPGTTLADLEREAIQQCLLQTGGHRRRAADLLGISTRTLLRKIREYNLEDPLRPAPPASE
jgi:two-component system, NtrC family, response regulator AtoC